MNWDMNWIIFWFFWGHWCFAAFHQSLKYHRDESHGLVPWTSESWKRFFEVTTFLSVGFTYLQSWIYGRLHRLHHAFADTFLDPHSPKHLRIRKRLLKSLPVSVSNVLRYTGFFVAIDFCEMMWMTSRACALAAEGKMLNWAPIAEGKEPICQPIEEKYLKNLSKWPAFENFATSTLVRILWLVFYISVYREYATGLWWLLLPIQIGMCPIHGASVNYFCHTIGYRNFNVKDTSTNLGVVVNIPGLARGLNVILNLPFWVFSVLLFGEGWHNNHHNPSIPKIARNFGRRWWEIDLTYLIKKHVMYPLGMIHKID